MSSHPRGPVSRTAGSRPTATPGRAREATQPIRVGPIHCYWSDRDEYEVISERLYATCDPCGHKTYEETPGVWVLAECKNSDIGRHVWRDDLRRIVPVEEYCGACGERRAKEIDARPVPA